MRNLKFIGEPRKGTWTAYFTVGGIYETSESVLHVGREIVRNDFLVALELNYERLMSFQEIE